MNRIWTIDDSPFENYVSMVNFDSGSAKECIVRELVNDANNAAIDLAGGSNGRAIVDLIDSGLIKQGLYTNFVDQRDTEQTNPNVHFLPGDLLSDQTWEEIRIAGKRIAPKGFKLALHRPFGALQDLESDDYIGGVKRVLDVLQPEGVFYTQVPGSPYLATDRCFLDEIYSAISEFPDVDRIICSVPEKTLADYAFSLIYKSAPPK